MAGYKYKVTVEKVEDRHGNPAEGEQISFHCENHDDILAIVERLNGHPSLSFEGDERVAFAVGLKLFGETLLKHRSDPVFEPLKDHFKPFMMGLKGGFKPDTTE
jgi:hypothetical protein